MADRKDKTVATDTGTEQAEAEGEKRARSIHGVYVSTPDELRQALEAEAAEKQTSVASLVRDMLAAHYNLVLPVAPAPRRKYADEDEKKAAQAKARQDKAALVKKLLEEYRAKMQAAGAAAA